MIIYMISTSYGANFHSGQWKQSFRAKCNVVIVKNNNNKKQAHILPLLLGLCIT